jgi:hypothetical protein
MEGYPEITKDNWNGGVQVEEEGNAGKYTADMKWNTPLPMAALSIIPATEAKSYVLANAGATLPKRDKVDIRIAEQVRTGKIVPAENVKLPETQFKHRRLPIDSYKQGIITDPSQVGGYPEYKGNPYKDSDNDGMPDDYEKKNGFNPNDASDAQAYAKSKSGYTNIEEYLNSVVPLGNVRPNGAKQERKAF